MPTTSPDSFFYPDDQSNNDLTQHVKDLADAVQAKFTAQETWNSWTPTFNTPTDGGITNVGSTGHRSGHYRRSHSGSGALVYAEFRFLLGGTGIAIQAGLFSLILPVEAHTWSGACQTQTVGEYSVRDDSSSPVNHHSGTLALYNSSDGTLVHFSGAVKASETSSRYRWDSNDPIALATGDNFTGHLLYRAV